MFTLPVLPTHEFVDSPILKSNFRPMFNEFNAISPEVALLMNPHSEAIKTVFADLCAYGFDPHDIANILISEIGIHASEAVLKNSCELRRKKLS